MLTLLPDGQDDKLQVIRRIRKLAADDALDQLDDDDRKRVDRLRRMAAVDTPVTVAALPSSLARLFETREDGVVFGLIYPKVRLRNGRNSIAFAEDVTDLETPSGNRYSASNSAVVLADMLKAITGEGSWVVLLALASVALVVFVTLRSVAGTLFALTPLLVGSLWMFAAMLILGTKFNFFNVVVIPSIVGIGIDSGVHLYMRYREEGTGSLPFVLRSTGGAITVSGLTTMVGFGGLLFAYHGGLKSIGYLAVGIGLVLVACLTVLPAALQNSERDS